jgi:hypothetical protein
MFTLQVAPDPVEHEARGLGALVPDHLCAERGRLHCACLHHHRADSGEVNRV